ncbi:MAG: VCBS repeat-containing protein [Bacteroidota bacterium]
MEDSPLSTPELAQLQCGACHQFPQPDLLDKTTWQNDVLPKMGYMMGFRSLHSSMEHQFIEGDLGTQLIDEAKAFHMEPILSEADWQRIQEWYINSAPEQLEEKTSSKTITALDLFEVSIPEQRFSPPGSALVHFMDNGKIMVGDMQKGLLLQYDDQLQFLKEARVGEGAVHLTERPDALWLTVMGNFLASDLPSGYLLKFPKDSNLLVDNPIKGLNRPVHSLFGDVNNDGREDVIIAEYGKWLGGLSWWENLGGRFEKHPISTLTGAISSYLYDFNQDGLMDVIALFGQGREGIHIFYQQNDGSFKDEEVLSFHPSMGSSFFQVYDFNKDGHMDILYTAGDNADYKSINKPYQGIYIFENDGNNQFNQTFFHPLHGAYKAIPEDFDQDGDLDLAVISFFPDYKNQPEESFVYLENQGNWTFQAKTFENPQMGRWISMDIGDPDKDGDMDLTLGSLAFEIPDADLKHIQNEWLKNGIHFILLRNTTQ